MLPKPNHIYEADYSAIEMRIHAQMVAQLGVSEQSMFHDLNAKAPDNIVSILENHQHTHVVGRAKRRAEVWSEGIW